MRLCHNLCVIMVMWDYEIICQATVFAPPYYDEILILVYQSTLLLPSTGAIPLSGAISPKVFVCPLNPKFWWDKYEVTLKGYDFLFQFDSLIVNHQIKPL